VSGKAQTRSPKSETRNARAWLRHSEFGLLSGFGLRNSDLGGWRRVVLSSNAWFRLDFRKLGFNTPSMAQVVLERLTKVFPGQGGEAVRAVDNLSLQVGDHELLVLVGPSGCGKTTTLRLIAGLEEPTAGTISIAGQVVNQLPPKDRDIAMVFQNHALYPHMTAYENMAFGLKLRHYSRAEIERRVKDAAQILNLASCLDRRPPTLSGGQRQRVALGRALVRQPRLFLLDEPLSDLDAQTRLQMRAEIARLHSRLAATMIYVTHDQVEAMTLGQRVAVMNAGVIQQVAAPADLYHQPANRFVAGFIGSPPMNFFEGTLSEKGDVLVFQETGRDGLVDSNLITVPLGKAFRPASRSQVGKQVVLGIRPEQIACLPMPADGLPEHGMEAVVEVVQPLGSETYLHLAGHAHSFVARVSATDPFRAGQKVSLTFDARHAHLFDPGSGVAIEEAL
jgi:multiple sugar transport system ATP-binding protein